MSDLQFLMNRLNQSKSPMEIAQERRETQKRNALADILNQQQIDQNNAVLRGTQLENTARARKMAKGPQNQFKTIQGRDGNSYQVEVAPNGQLVGQPKMVEGLGQAQRKNDISKLPSGAERFLPPEIIVNPNSVDAVTFNKLAVDAVRKNKANPVVDPMDELNRQLKAAQVAEKQGKVREIEDQQEKAAALKDQVVSLAKELQSHKGLDRSVGTLQGSGLGQMVTMSGDSQDFINKHNRLKSLLTAENLGIMSGVLSESDLKVISDIAGGSLQLRGSEEAYRAELAKLTGEEGDVVENPIPGVRRVSVRGPR